MIRTTILLADDHKIMIEGLKKLLEPHFEIAGTVEDGGKLFVEARRLQPDVVLLDISMPGLNGVEAALQLKKDLPNPKIIFLTMHAEPVYISGAFRVGANGYVLKRCASAELVDAIRQVLLGRTYVTPEIASDFALADPKAENSTRDLTSREREVLRAVAQGKSAKEIAAVLNISPKTVTFHKSNIMQKLALHTTAGLTKFAMQNGLVDE
jgi:DNA-binding NarL/FixJ family response regulator